MADGRHQLTITGGMYVNGIVAMLGDTLVTAGPSDQQFKVCHVIPHIGPLFQIHSATLER